MPKKEHVVGEYSAYDGCDIMNPNEEVREMDGGFYKHLKINIKKSKQVKSKYQKSF